MACCLCPMTIAYAIVGFFVLNRLYVYRYVRKYQGFVIFAYLLYRGNEVLPITGITVEKFTTLLDVISSGLKMLHSQYHVPLPILRMAGDFIAILALIAFVNVLNSFLKTNIRGMKKDITDWGFNLVKDFSFVKGTLEKEQSKLEQSFDKELKTKARNLGVTNRELPSDGMSHEDILSLMSTVVEKENVIWEKGHLSGSVYHGQHGHKEFLNKCFGFYSLSNPLHPDIWPSVMKYESEIISMTANLVNGGKESVCGCTTSGGTESIILAIKAHRDHWRENYGITEPELICAVTAHAAVDKACDMMNIKLIKVDVDPVTFRINLRSLKRAIGPNTIMMYASAPTYPHGSIDPVREMSKIAQKYNIGLHVDCCLGGFVLPFAKKAGFSIPDFDFHLPGVTTMSLDTHKYGYALKGSSVLLFRDRAIRHSAYFCYADWTGGMYTTPTVAGSRSGGIIAQTWASMMTLGMKGYVKHAKEIMDTTRIIAEGVKKIDGITLLGNVDAMIVCFGGTADVNVYSVGDKMHHKGWSLNALQHPPCVHLCVTVAHVGHHQEFLQDLEVSVMEVKNSPDNKSGNAAIYGMTSALPPGPVNELLKVYNDVVLKI